MDNVVVCKLHNFIVGSDYSTTAGTEGAIDPLAIVEVPLHRGFLECKIGGFGSKTASVKLLHNFPGQGIWGRLTQDVFRILTPKWL